jgi:excisionase family DNA binding protein
MFTTSHRWKKMKQQYSGEGTWITPPQVARQFAVSVEKVLAWIRNGELRAMNVAQRLGGRPRWRISPAALEEFIKRRESAASPPVQKSRSSINWSSVDGRGKVIREDDGRIAANIPHEERVRRMAKLMAAREFGGGADWEPYVHRAITRYAEKTGVHVSEQAVSDE